MLHTVCDTFWTLSSSFLSHDNQISLHLQVLELQFSLGLTLYLLWISPILLANTVNSFCNSSWPVVASQHWLILLCQKTSSSPLFLHQFRMQGRIQGKAQNPAWSLVVKPGHFLVLKSLGSYWFMRALSLLFRSSSHEIWTFAVAIQIVSANGFVWWATLESYLQFCWVLASPAIDLLKLCCVH